MKDFSTFSPPTFSNLVEGNMPQANSGTISFLIKRPFCFKGYLLSYIAKSISDSAQVKLLI